MQIELSEQEIGTISECLLFVFLHIDEYENDKVKQFKKLYAKMVKVRAKKDQKNEN